MASIMAFILAGVVIALVVAFLYLYREDDEDYYDDTIFLNTMTQYSDGYSKGKILKIIQGTKRTGVIFKPTDINKFNVKKRKEKIEPQGPIWLEKNQLKFLPKGSWSERRNELLALPPTIGDFGSEELKNLFGDKVLNKIEETNQFNTEKEIFRNRIRRQNSFLDETEGLGIAEDTINLQEEAMKQLAKSIGKDDKKYPSDYKYPGN